MNYLQMTPMTEEERDLYNKINAKLLSECKRTLSPRDKELGYKAPFHVLRKSRSMRHQSNVGRFYIVDVYTNYIVGVDIDINKFYKNKIWKNFY